MMNKVCFVWFLHLFQVIFSQTVTPSNQQMAAAAAAAIANTLNTGGTGAGINQATPSPTQSPNALQWPMGNQARAPIPPWRRQPGPPGPPNYTGPPLGRGGPPPGRGGPPPGRGGSPPGRGGPPPPQRGGPWGNQGPRRGPPPGYRWRSAHGTAAQGQQMNPWLLDTRQYPHGPPPNARRPPHQFPRRGPPYGWRPTPPASRPHGPMCPKFAHGLRVECPVIPLAERQCRPGAMNQRMSPMMRGMSPCSLGEMCCDNLESCTAECVRPCMPSPINQYCTGVIEWPI